MNLNELPPCSNISISFSNQILTFSPPSQEPTTIIYQQQISTRRMMSRDKLLPITMLSPIVIESCLINLVME